MNVSQWESLVEVPRDAIGPLAQFIPDTPWLIEQDGVWLVTEQTYILLTVGNLFDQVYYSGISVPYHGQVYGDPRKATLSLRKSF